ncbi:MAG: hypothetical protein JKY50_12750 [Oleispira sp.]|nr:hypothetical protein [Oleispira sp.]MBL4880279.1 hypothetical protein [Oleispira sp.]
MELNKTLMLSTLFSALVLTGCGGGGGGGGGGTDDTGADNSGEGPGNSDPTNPDPANPDSTNPDSTNPDPVDPNFGFVDAYSTKISGDIQAAVKAATFFKYEEDVANYELAFDYVADYSSQLGDLLVEQLNGLDAVEQFGLYVGVRPVGDCVPPGKAYIQGTVTEVNFKAAAYCSKLKIDGNPTGDELTLSGGAHLIVDESSYSLELTGLDLEDLEDLKSAGDVVDVYTIKYDAFDADIADVIVEMLGTVGYSETDSGQQLAVNAEVIFDGVAGNYNFTQICENGTCSIDANISGAGNNYTVNGLTVTSPNGYTGSADISYNDVLGELAVSFDQIQYCADGSIDSGTMNIIETDGAEIATTFNGCGVEPLVEFYADGTP